MSPRLTPSSSLRSRRGNYMITMASFFPILVGFAALSVDISYINLARTQSQHVADAASHGAYIGYQLSNSTAAGNAAANYILDQNLVGKQRATLDGVSYGRWDFNSQTFDPGGQINSARASVSRSGGNTLDLFFAPLLGKPTHDVQALGVTAGRAREMIVINDISGSFGEEINDAAFANGNFAKYIAEHPVPGDRLGMSVFAGRETFDMMQDLTLVASGPVAIENRFRQLKTCYDIADPTKTNPPVGVNRSLNSGCYTNHARGILNALEVFNDPNKSNPDNFRGMVILSDGLPNTALHSTSNGSDASLGKADAEALLDVAYYGGTYNYNSYNCTGNISNANCSVEAESITMPGGIHAWTVTLCQNGCAGVAWQKTLWRGDGFSQENGSAAELDAMMTRVARSVPVVLTE